MSPRAHYRRPSPSASTRPFEEELVNGFRNLLIQVATSCVLILLTIITLPYTLFYYSANWSMLDRDMSAVRVYPDHFQVLYPHLAIASAGTPQHAFREPSSAYDRFLAIEKIPVKSEQPHVHHAICIFASKQRGGVGLPPRQAGTVSPAQKAAFAKVMKRWETQKSAV